MERMEMRVNRDRPLKKGDMLSFFYPSLLLMHSVETSDASGVRRCKRYFT